MSILVTVLLACGYQAKCQKSTSGYILFGKNKTEGDVVCSQQGICKLQQIEEAGMIPVTFTAMPLNDSSTEFNITMSFNLNTQHQIQPNQDTFFTNRSEPYTISDKFTFPAWLITELGFDRSKNRFIVLNAPFSLGVPSSPNSEGNITLMLAENLTINK